MRAFGCLGCLPFGGLLTLLMPLIVIGLVIYLLMNRQRTSPPPTGYQLPDAFSRGVCPSCGTAIVAGNRFCAHCGRPIDGA